MVPPGETWRYLYARVSEKTSSRQFVNRSNGIPPTGRSIEVTEIHVYRLEDGKAVEHRVGRDDLGAMRQLGVTPNELPGPGAASRHGPGG
jgi:hypothetical protein